MANTPTYSVRELLADERVAGFTHVAKLAYTDLTTAGTAQTIAIMTTASGQVITNAGFFLRTQFSGGSATALTLILGDATDDNGFVEAVSLLNGATPILAGLGNGAYFATKLTGKAYVAAGVVNVIFTSTTANVNTLTAGEVDVYLSFADFNTITP